MAWPYLAAILLPLAALHTAWRALTGRWMGADTFLLAAMFAIGAAVAIHYCFVRAHRA